MRNLIILFCLCIFSNIKAQFPTSVYLTEYASGIERITEITHANDQRLFVCTQLGIIHIVDENATILEEPFLDISNLVDGTGERGLLSLAFHPEYEINGWFFVFYVDEMGVSYVSRFTVDANDSNLSDPNSEKVIFRNEPYVSFLHYGGCLRFGPEGYLYISLGDAGYFDIAQDLNSYEGKLLRINVDSGDPYAIPSDNPYFNNTQTHREIYAIGLRNSWRFSFDRLNGDLWLSDVGFELYEEINHVPADNVSPVNFGWPCYEGPFPDGFNAWDCGDSTVVDYTPASTGYLNDDVLSCGGSITGGYVYRGKDEKLNEFGAYIFADFCSGNLGASYQINGKYETIDIYQNDSLNSISTIGENVEGELFVSDFFSGKIWELNFNCNLPKVRIVDASCSIAEDGCIEITIPENENIEGVELYDSEGNFIDQNNYCSLSVGEYFLRSVNADPDCTIDIVVNINSFEPIIKTRDAQNCLSSNGNVEVFIIQELDDNFGYYITNEFGEIIDTSDYFNLTVGIYNLVAGNDSINCFEQYEFEIDFFDDFRTIEFENGTLSIQDTFAHYQWVYGENNDWMFDTIVGANEHSYVPTLSGYYRLYMIGFDGCDYRSNRKEIILSSTNELIEYSKLVLSPNPVTNQLNIDYEMNKSGVVDVEIYSKKGELVYKETLQAVNQRIDAQLSVQNLPTGVYIVCMTSGGIMESEKFVKM